NGVDPPFLDRGLPTRIRANNAVSETKVDASRFRSLYPRNRFPRFDFVFRNIHDALDRRVRLGVVTDDLDAAHNGVAGFEGKHCLFRRFLKANETVLNVTCTLAFRLEQTDRRLDLVLAERIEGVWSRRFGCRRRPNSLPRGERD